jgi:hypothetical protein
MSFPREQLTHARRSLLLGDTGSQVMTATTCLGSSRHRSLYHNSCRDFSAKYAVLSNDPQQQHAADTGTFRILRHLITDAHEIRLLKHVVERQGHTHRPSVEHLSRWFVAHLPPQVSQSEASFRLST